MLLLVVTVVCPRGCCRWWCGDSCERTCRDTPGSGRKTQTPKQEREKDDSAISRPVQGAAISMCLLFEWLTRSGLKFNVAQASRLVAEATMVKKKIDPRVRTLIENGVAKRHRSLFVLVSAWSVALTSVIEVAQGRSKSQARNNFLVHCHRQWGHVAASRHTHTHEPSCSSLVYVLAVGECGYA